MNRNEHTGIKNFIVIVAILVVLGLCYYASRLARNPSPAKLVGLINFSSMPSTICTVTYGSFEGASVGRIYISGGKIREDAKVLKGGEAWNAHFIYTEEDNGTAYIWYDEQPQKGGKITNVFAHGGFAPIDGTVSCSPWWRPNKAAFELPQDVNFDAAQ